MPNPRDDRFTVSLTADPYRPADTPPARNTLEITAEQRIGFSRDGRRAGCLRLVQVFG
jgi:hypothetical protein